VINISIYRGKISQGVILFDWFSKQIILFDCMVLQKMYLKIKKLMQWRERVPVCVCVLDRVFDS